MLTSELYSLLELPSDIHTLFLTYDRERVHSLDAALLKDLLQRERWNEAVRCLEDRCGEDPDNLIVLWEELAVLAGYTYPMYTARQLPKTVFTDTMKFVTRYLTEAWRTGGTYRFIAASWFPRELALQEFRLGTLEYELADLEERRIYLHIPSDADMRPESIDRSFRLFTDFLARFYPGWLGVPWYCNSWMLSPKIRPLLSPASNILRFQDRFEIDSVDGDNDHAIGWIFPNQGTDAACFTENTSLQKAMKAFLLEGNIPGWALGHLRIMP